MTHTIFIIVLVILAILFSPNSLAIAIADIAMLFMPYLTGIATRLIFRKSNRKLLATLIALPFTMYLLKRFDFPPDFLFDERHVTNRIVDWVVVLCATILVNFCIPYSFVNSGISYSDRIMKRTSNQPSEPAPLEPQDESEEQNSDQT